MATQKVLFIQSVAAIPITNSSLGSSYELGEVRTIDSTIATSLISANIAVAWDATTYSNPNLPTYIMINLSKQNY